MLIKLIWIGLILTLLFGTDFMGTMGYTGKWNEVKNLKIRKMERRYKKMGEWNII